MVGDLFRVNRDKLCIKKDTIVQVRGIDGDDKLEKYGLFGAAHCHPLAEKQFDGGIWLDYLDPIPLTQEILEKNGFQCRELGCWSLVTRFVNIRIKRTDKWHIMIRKKDEKGKSEQVSYYRDWAENVYVHDLQHALKLCGINKEIQP
jgi:hypothetical protein